MAKLLLNYCLVTQNLASIIEDSIYDIDRFPDVSNISGEVIFTPNIPNGKAYQLFDNDGKSYTVPVGRIQAKIIDGEIVHESSPGIYLFAAGAGSNPDKITYSVEYRNLRSGKLSFSLSPLKFEAIPGGEVDLTMATPVVGATPAGIVRGPRGTSLEAIVVDGSELVFTAADEVHSFEMSRIPLDEMVRAEADAAAEGVRDALAVDVTASQSARDKADSHAKRAATSESNAKTSETNAKQSETNARSSEESAGSSATEARGSRNSAANSALEAGSYADTAQAHSKQVIQARDEVVPLAEKVATDASATAAHREHVDDQVSNMDTVFTESIPPYLQPDAPGGLKETYSVASEATMVNALRYVKGDGTDETVQLQAAADAARSSGRGLCLPEGVNVRIDGEVSLRFIDNLDLRGGISVGPQGLLLCGSNSVLRRGMKIHIRSVTLVSRNTQTNVALRFVGVKGAYIDVRNCDSMEFYADVSDPTTASISYNTISLGQIRKLSIRGVGEMAWITQLLFIGGDIKDLTVSGDYGHNEIIFLAPCFEGGNIDFQVGVRIRAINARCEDGTQIRFGRRATLNVIEDSYTAHSGVFTPTAKVVEDLGLGNQVISARLTYMKSHELTSIDSRSLIFDQARDYKGEGIVPGVNTLTVRAWSYVLDTGIIPIREKSWTGIRSTLNWDMSNFLIVSDKPNWRFYVDLYDKDGARIIDENGINTSDGWKQTESGGFYFETNVDTARIVVTGRDVAAIRIRARAGSGVIPFKFLRLIGYTQSSDTDYPVELWRNELKQGLYQPTKPTRGFAPVGTVVEGGEKRWVSTWSSKSSLLTDSISGANELQLKDSLPAMAGDVLGVELSNGTTHWTAISGIDGDLVTLLSPIPSGAAESSPVSITRWSP